MKLNETIVQAYMSLTQVAYYIGLLDIYTSHARFAHQYQRTRPSLTDNHSLSIDHGRHPVIQHHLTQMSDFVPNSLALGEDA